jgi:hypothetical protein
MFVALKNWRERLKHQGGDVRHRLLARSDRALSSDPGGSGDLLQSFRALALAPDTPRPNLPSLGELGAQFAGSEPLSTVQNLSIMASVERGTARPKRTG